MGSGQSVKYLNINQTTEELAELMMPSYYVRFDVLIEFLQKISDISY